MAMNDFIRFMRTPLGINIESPPYSPLLQVRADGNGGGYVVLPIPASDPPEAGSIFLDAGTGLVSVVDAGGKRSV